MRIALFYHSLVSDWNHGNAHFLRGVVGELKARGHDVRVYEPANAWSVTNLVADHGPGGLEPFHRVYRHLASDAYDADSLDLDAVLADVDLVIVHEWNEPALVARIGEHRAARGRYALLFHDTHHRMVSVPEQMQAYDLSRYDGVLAFGEVIRRAYLNRGMARAAWTWHEAADTRVFYPRQGRPRAGELVWIGNFGDGERGDELDEFLIDPARRLGLQATVYGVRYPPQALAALARAGIRYAGYLPNPDVPEAFARHDVTLHIPRRYYARQLPGIPTIRPFEAMACGIPLISAVWDDAEQLFTPGRDYLVARDGGEMTAHLRRVLQDRHGARAMADHALRTIRQRHTCAHRVNGLLEICHELGMAMPARDRVRRRPLVMGEGHSR
ncbi:MAG: glycosyltransferase [Phycisphaeraceae bacterium]